MDYKLELVAIPVTDVDRAKAFYVDQAGFNADHDHVVNENLRFVQLTPPGSACSIAIGQGMTDRRRGSCRACSSSSRTPRPRRGALRPRRRVGEVQDFPWGRFVFFADPDGNAWAVQEIQPPRS